jgi:hypothetical protein
MPEIFDPAWEYYTPMPEVAELFDRAGECPALARLGWDRQRQGPAPGVQFTTSPNGYRSRLAPARVVLARAGPTRADCRRCGWPFLTRPGRPGRYCSRACYEQAVRRATDRRPAHRLARPSTCRTCAKSFHPWTPGAVYCSRACYERGRVLLPKPCRACGRPFRPDESARQFCSRACSPKIATRPTPAAVLGEFARLWVAGRPVAELVRRFGVNRATLTNWRRALALDPRPRGGAHASGGTRSIL